jgi:hypothetical protein
MFVGSIREHDMAANKSTSKRTTKQKATARQNAMERVATRRGTGGTPREAPTGNKAVSQSRFPGETPLTGEDRPSRRPGGKRQGRAARSGGRARSASRQ